jgi:hypothetical protein
MNDPIWRDAAEAPENTTLLVGPGNLRFAYRLGDRWFNADYAGEIEPPKAWLDNIVVEEKRTPTTAQAVEKMTT